MDGVRYAPRSVKKVTENQSLFCFYIIPLFLLERPIVSKNLRFHPKIGRFWGVFMIIRKDLLRILDKAWDGICDRANTQIRILRGYSDSPEYAPFPDKRQGVMRVNW